MWDLETYRARHVRKLRLSTLNGPNHQAKVASFPGLLWHNSHCHSSPLVPYTIAIIELQEGVRMVSCVMDIKRATTRHAGRGFLRGSWYRVSSIRVTCTLGFIGGSLLSLCLRIKLLRLEKHDTRPEVSLPKFRRASAWL